MKKKKTVRDYIDDVVIIVGGIILFFLVFSTFLTNIIDAYNDKQEIANEKSQIIETEESYEAQE